MAIALVPSSSLVLALEDEDELEEIMPREPSERERLMDAVNFLLEIRSEWPDVIATVFAHQELRDRVITLERILGDRAITSSSSDSDPPPQSNSDPPPRYDLGAHVSGTGSHIIMTVDDARREGFVVTSKQQHEKLKHDAAPWRWFKKLSQGALKEAYSHIITIIATGTVLELVRFLYAALSHK